MIPTWAWLAIVVACSAVSYYTGQRVGYYACFWIMSDAYDLCREKEHDLDAIGKAVEKARR